MLSPVNLVMLYLVVVVISAVFLGRGPSILASALSVLAFDFFFVPPHLTFAVSDTEYILTFIGLFLVGLVISTLAARAREQADAARLRAEQTTELYELSRDLAAVYGLNDILRALIRHIQGTFGRDGVILLPDDGRLTSTVGSGEPGTRRERIGRGRLGLAARRAGWAEYEYPAGGPAALPAAEDRPRRPRRPRHPGFARDAMAT